MKFTIKKVPISKEEKRERAEFFVEDTGQSVDVEAFVNSDVYDEFVDFKCLKCNHEEELEADIVFELFFPEFEDFPVLTCPKCGKDTFIPKDIYLLKVKK